MRFGEVYDYRTAEEAKKFIGKKGLFSDYLRAITESPTECCFEGTFRKVEKEEGWPFFRERVKSGYQFFRPILEEDELMTNRQLAEWLAKGKGEMTLENNDSYIYTEKVHFKGDADKPVRDDVIIRHWGDSEWSKPTKAIYEEDCIPNTAINKEDCK